MKLAFCLFRYFLYGGLQRDFLRIAEECLKRGHTVQVYTMHWEGPRDPKLPVTLIKPKGWQNHSQRESFINQLQVYLKNQSYDLIIGFNKMPGLDIYYAADTCFQARARARYGAWCRFMPRYRHLVADEQAVFSKNSRTQILLISKAQQADFMQFYKTPPERFYLLPPGIAKDRIAGANAADIRATVRNEFAIQDDQFLVLFVGSGFKTKGLDRILLGIASLPAPLKIRTQLLIIGKDKPAAFQERAKKLTIFQQIKFLGGREDIPRFLLAADALLHPAYNENTGTVLLEALAAGLPVLTTDVCGYAEYITRATAGIVLASPYQQEQFNQSLQDMLLSPHKACWRKNALKFTQEADIYNLPTHAVDVMETLYAKTRS